jgi:hypothetical protein
LTPAYTEFVQTISRALYDVDPQGIGSSIDAPLDEYDDLAHRLASDLVLAASVHDAGRITTSIVSSGEEPLIVRLWSAVQEYQANLGPDA